MKTLLVLIALAGWSARAAAGPQAAPGASRAPLVLRDLQQQAVDADPRLGELQLEADKTARRIQNIDASKRPTLSLNGLTQYQSDVPTPPPSLLSGQPLFSAPKDTYDAYLKVEQPLIDPTIGPRLDVERAALEETQAKVRTAVYALRQEVNDTFFAAVLLQERLSAVAATIRNLEGRLQETTVRVREGAALPDEAAAIEATLLERQRDQSEIQANRRAALARLADLTARAISDQDVLALPDLTSAVAGARARLSDLRARPEYEQFMRTRDRLAREQAAATADDKPRVSAFARGGYGHPGLDFITDQFQGYWLGGVQFQWKALNWGTTARSREVLSLQQQITLADEAAFTAGLRRGVEADLATIDRLTDALAFDDRIIGLREGIDARAQVRLREGDVTAAEYLDRDTELLQARLTRSGHQVEQAQAGARFLTTMGLEVR